MTLVKFLKSTVSAFCIVSACAGALPAYANPEGGVVAAGQASISSAGNTLSVHQSSDRAIIDWRSFNIAPHETTAFHQPSSSSLTLNRVHSMDPSQILGTLTANGHVVIVNPNGVFFGQGSRVDVGSITATTSNISNANFMAGHLNFDQPGVDHGEIVNEGTITAADAGLVNLVAPRVRNSGVIQARLGKINLASGEKFTLDLANDGLLQIAVDKDSLVGQSIKNTGTLSAQGGQIHLTAAAARSAVDGLIINTGVIEAKSFGTKKGSVKLAAAGSNAVENNIAADKGVKQGQTAVVNSGTIDVSGSEVGQMGGDVSLLADQVWLESGSNINASGSQGGGDIKIGGDYQGLGTTPTASRVYVARNTSMSVDALESGDAGRAIVWADDSTHFFGNIYARGGRLSGDGGFVEVSGKEYLNYKGFVDTRAENGQTGLLFLDPANIVIANGSGDGAADGTATFSGSGTAGTVAGGDAGPSTIYESELEGIAATTNISVAATNSITINNLTTDGNLNLAQNAGRSVTFTTGAGGFIMQNTANTITTAGGAINITTTGGGATLGNLATNGGLITLNVVGNSSVGTISGTGTALTKTGAGTLTMSGNNTYTGTTTLTTGTITVGNNAAFGTGTLSLNGGMLQGDGTARTLANAISLANSSTIAGSSALTFNGAFTNTNNLTLTNNNAGGFTLGAVALSNSATNRTLTIAGTGLTTINGVIANGGTSTASAITKTGTGTLALNGTNTFAGATTLTAGTIQVGSNTALGTGTLSLNGGTLQGDGTARTLASGISIAQNSTIAGSSALAFTSVFTNTNNLTLTNNNAGGFTLGAVNLSSDNNNRTLTIAGTGNTTIGGVIANGGTSTASALTKTGTGVLTLGGVNTYAGTTTISGGTLRYNVNNALAAGAVTVNAGGTYDLNGFSDTIGALTVNSGVTGGAVTTGAGTLTLGGNITSTGGASNASISGNLALGSANRTVTTTNAADGLTISAVISGARSLTKAGAGSVVLSGSNTYTLGTTLTTGTITAGNNTALGTGTLTLNGGTLQGDGTARALANAITLSNNSTIAGSSALTFNGTLTNSNGNRTLTNNNAGGFTLGAVNLSNNGTSRTLTIAGTGLTTINGVIANGSTSTAGAITKTGTGTLVLNGTNTFAGAKTLTAGTVQVGNNAAFGTGTVTLNGAILQGDGTARTLANAVSLNAASTIGGSSALTFNGTFTNTNNLTLTNNNAGGFTLGAVALSNSATNRTLTIAGTGLTTINGVISNGSTSTAGALTKTGTGTLALNGNNTFAGAKTLTQGIVQVGHNNAFGTGTVTLNGATLQGDGTARTLANAVTHAAASTIGGSSALTFNGALTNNGDFTLTNNNSGGVTLSAVNLSNSATNRTLTIAGTGNTTIGGVIANGSTSTASALTKTGAGTLTLSGANTYAGATTVDGGTLRLGAANRISDSSALTVNASGTFDFNNFSETLNAITASGQVNFGTGNTITTAGAQNYTGIVNGGAVSLVSTGGGAITANNAANNFTGQLGVSTAGAVNLRDANALTLGAVSGSTITALAGGALTLNGIVSASATTGTPLVLSTGGAFVNSVGASALQTGVGGRWLVYSATPLGDTRGGLVHNFKQYNAAYGDTVLGTGNGFIYTVAPTVTASLTGVVNKTYNGTVAATLSGSNYSTSGAIDGDTVIINTPTSGAYDNANAGTGKNVAVNGVTISSANNGGVTVYGYQLANGSINGNVGVIDQAALTLSTTDVTKQFDGTTSALGTAILTAGTLYTNQSNGNILDSFNGGTFLFDSPTAGTGKTVSVSGVAVNDGNAGNNYIINYQNNTNSTIVALPAVPVQQTQTQVASIVSSSSGSNAPVLSQENAGISVIDNGFRLNSDFKFLENIDIEIGFLDTLDTGIVEITRESFANASPDDQKQKVCADGVSEC